MIITKLVKSAGWTSHWPHLIASNVHINFHCHTQPKEHVGFLWATPLTMSFLQVQSLTISCCTRHRLGWCHSLLEFRTFSLLLLMWIPSEICLDIQSRNVPVTFATKSASSSWCFSIWCFLMKESLFLFLLRYLSWCHILVCTNFLRSPLGIHTGHQLDISGISARTAHWTWGNCHPYPFLPCMPGSLYCHSQVCQLGWTSVPLLHHHIELQSR